MQEIISIGEIVQQLVNGILVLAGSSQQPAGVQRSCTHGKHFKIKNLNVTEMCKFIYIYIYIYICSAPTQTAASTLKVEVLLIMFKPKPNGKILHILIKRET